MSGGRSGRGVAGKGASEDAAPIDLDMTPMMNMLIILISFLVTMVVFTQLAVIKFDLPPATDAEGEGAAAADSAKPGADVDITLVLSESGFQIIGEGRKLDPIPRRASGYDFPRLGQFMKKLKQEYPGAEAVVMLIDSAIIYQDIIAAMDVCRDNKFPNIMLSGGIYQ